MGRAIVGVIVGYLVFFVLVFATFTAAYLGMGADRAFQPGTYEVSVLWITVSFTLGSLAALTGGFVCAKLSRGGKAPLVLAGVVLVLGLVPAIPVLMAPASAEEVRSGEVSNMDAMMKAKQPPWMLLFSPLVSAVGILLGSRLVRSTQG